MGECGINEQGCLTLHQKRAKIYLDILRIVAIFFVVYNHTPGSRFLPYGEWSDMSYWSMLFVNQIVKMAVPVFLLVSGALLLNRCETVAVVMKKRVMRFIVIILLITSVQYTISCYWENKEFTLKGMFSLSSLKCDHNEFFACWFLYVYLGILIILPILRKLVQSVSDKMFIYLMGVQFICCCIIPVMCLFLGNYVDLGFVHDWMPFISRKCIFPFTVEYCIFYVILGYFLEHRVPADIWDKRRGLLFAVAIGCLIGGAVCMEMERRCLGTVEIQHTTVFLKSFLPVPCMLAYMGVKSFCQSVQVGMRARKMIAVLGGATFSVMLLENLFRVQWGWMWQPLANILGLIPATLVYSALIWSAALCVGVLLKQVPWLNRYV